MTDSQRLLLDYVANGSETAFRELVTRYADLVYSTALRLVNGDTHRAEDVVQIVFVDLAQCARKLAKETMLGGWLHRHTCFVAAKMMRGDRRRLLREKIAAEMNTLNSSDTGASRIASILDEAINALGEQDRRAIILRFYEQLDLRSVGEAMGKSENAAQKLVTRAVDQLHTVLTRRGVATPAATLTIVLGAHAITVAPTGLASSVAGAALASATTGTGIGFTTFKIMTMSKIKAGIACLLLVGAAGTGLVLQHQNIVRLREDIRTLRQQLDGSIQAGTKQPVSTMVSGTEVSGQLATEQWNELLRLRGEVTVLRKQLGDAAATAVAAKQSSLGAETNPLPVQATKPFRSLVHTQLKPGETLITGGWATAPGRRMLVFVKPELGRTDDGKQTISLHSTGIEMPDHLLAGRGLESLETNTGQTEQHGQIFASTDAEALFKELSQLPEATQSKMGTITSFPGQSSQLQVTRLTGGGETMIVATPGLAEDGRGVDLQLNAVVAPAPKLSIPQKP